MSEYSLRWYQSQAEEAILNYFLNGNKGNPLVAMPTGTGKSIVIASFIYNVMMRWPTQRIMMLTHVKELIAQNGSKLLRMWANCPLGFHSSGLSKRDFEQPVIFGGIQSVAPFIKKAVESNSRHFKPIDLIIVDEAHLISPSQDTLYQYVIKELLKLNPNLKIIGFTATPYRLKQGLLTEGGVFTDICFDITDAESFRRLFKEGFLAPVIPKATNVEFDISNVPVRGGEYAAKEMEAAVNRDELTYKALLEVLELGKDRHSWLLFASSINHAISMNDCLNYLGVKSAVVHSDQPKQLNDYFIAEFKKGNYHALVNKDKLTTGFDHPPLDLIGVFRGLLSASLWVQMIGRGTRPYDYRKPDEVDPSAFPYVKENCLVLDFAGNTKRLGPIDDPIIPKRPKKGMAGDAPVKVCENVINGSKCNTYNPASARVCFMCGGEFPIDFKFKDTASTEQLISSEFEPEIEEFLVNKVVYGLHEKKNKDGLLLSPPSIKVSYFSGFKRFNEWVCLEHSGYAGNKAKAWWKDRCKGPVPSTTHEALQEVSKLKCPVRIKVITNKKHPEIVGCEYF